MLRYSAAFAVALAFSLSAAPASAQSSFTETCSNYGFVYSGNDAAIQATCLTNSQTPHATSLILKGIVVVNGVLTDLHSSSVPSNFQTFCGSIRIISDGPYVTLSAYCPAGNKQFNETSILLNDINNSDGNLVHGQH